MRKYIFILVFVTIHLIGSAQLPAAFIPDLDYKMDKTKFELLCAKFNLDAKAVKLSNEKAEKEVELSIEKHVEDFVELNKNGLLMYNDSLSRYLQKLASKIISSNEELESKVYYIFTGKDAELNAYSYGEGIIVFNVGLLEQLGSEGEIAFVLAHELAHDYLKHLWKRVENRALILNDPEFKKELKKVVNREYGSYKAVDSVLSIYVTEVMRNSRENELEADSLGLIFLKNAGYSVMDAKALLSRLDTIDHFQYKDSLRLNEFFDFEDYGFKTEWLKYVSEETWGASQDYYKIPDSLKTHPDALLRLKRIENGINEADSGSNFTLVNKSDYPYSSLASLYNLQALTESGNIDFALYQSINLLKDKDSMLFIHATVTECLYSIWRAKKQYKFSTVVGHDSQLYPKSFNDFLHYLHTINSGVYLNHTYHYYEKNVKGKLKGEYADYLSILIQSLEKESVDLKSEVELFKRKYGEQHYYKKLTLHLNLIKK